MSAVELLDISATRGKQEMYVLTDFTFLSQEDMILVVLFQFAQKMVNSRSTNLLLPIGSEEIALKDLSLKEGKSTTTLSV